MVIKLSISVGLHDVYPAMVVNFAFLKKVKKIKCVNYQIKRRKRGKNKGKRKIIDHMIGQKWHEIFALRRSVSWRN